MTPPSLLQAFQRIFESVAALESDQTPLSNALLNAHELAICFSDPDLYGPSLQTNGIARLEMADVMDAIAEAIRDQARAT